MIMTLWGLAAGQSGRIEGFDETLPDHYRVRLMELGFHPGEQVHCMQAPAFGAPRVYRVSNTIFSLDDEVADHITLSADTQP